MNVFPSTLRPGEGPGSEEQMHLFTILDSVSQSTELRWSRTLLSFLTMDGENDFTCLDSCAGILSSIRLALIFTVSLEYRSRILRLALSADSKLLSSRKASTACGIPPTIMYVMYMSRMRLWVARPRGSMALKSSLRRSAVASFP